MRSFSINYQPLTIHNLTPAQALLRLQHAALPHLALLESLGPLTPNSRHTFLSAAPVQVVRELPPRPEGDGFFPAWIGGLNYETAAEFGLAVPGPPQAQAQWWGLYPSGLVWDRELGTLQVVGTPHLDWAALLSGPEATPSLTVTDWTPDDLNYEAGVTAIQELIRAGEVYQVNLSRGMSVQAVGDPLAAYLRLRQDNPSPYMAYLDTGAEVVVSCSPEQLVRWQGDTLSTRPIAGTRRRGATPAEDAALEAELRASPKERGEHTMLLDLLRHDLGGVAAPGTVFVPELGVVERYSHVMHLVSEVQAQARVGLTLPDVVQAMFPGGTITGAPKERVMQAIAELEPQPRGWYTGSVGIVSGAHLELNILIRTAAFTRTAAMGWTVTVRSGGGTVIDSDPHREAQETVHKAQALLSVLGRLGGRPRQEPQAPTPGQTWAAPAAPRQVPLRVLLLDNRDSFTHNLLHDLWALGASVDLRSQDESVEALLATQPQAVLIGPGPGTPSSSGVTLPLTRACLNAGIPLLGVCLGHQALGEVLGGRLERAAPVHGQPDGILHNASGLFAGIPQGAEFGRYHSLIIRGLEQQVIARNSEGEIMALAAARAWGVQFHPESVLSSYGRVLLGNWLALSAGL